MTERLPLASPLRQPAPASFGCVAAFTAATHLGHSFFVCCRQPVVGQILILFVLLVQVLARPLRLSGDFDFAAVAKRTPGFVGADLQVVMWLPCRQLSIYCSAVVFAPMLMQQANKLLSARLPIAMPAQQLIDPSYIVKMRRAPTWSMHACAGPQAGSCSECDLTHFQAAHCSRHIR